MTEVEIVDEWVMLILSEKLGSNSVEPENKPAPKKETIKFDPNSLKLKKVFSEEDGEYFYEISIDQFVNDFAKFYDITMAYWIGWDPVYYTEIVEKGNGNFKKGLEYWIVKEKTPVDYDIRDTDFTLRIVANDKNTKPKMKKTKP